MDIKRTQKGKSLYAFPDDYTVVDIETSGFYASSCEILEISALKVRNNSVVDSFSMLIKPSSPIPWYITNLTGITNQMVQDAPDISTVLWVFYNFIGDDILMGYNVHFDVNFLYDNMVKYFNKPIQNDFVDVLRFARRALPNLTDKKQTTVARYFGINIQGAHRALKDCEICNLCYINLRSMLN